MVDEFNEELFREATIASGVLEGEIADQKYSRENE